MKNLVLALFTALLLAVATATSALADPPTAAPVQAAQVACHHNNNAPWC